MKKAYILTLLFFASLLMVSCDTNDDTFIPEENSNTTINYDFGSTVSRDFIGQIVNENENPVPNAIVSIGSSTAQTDINGVFIIKNASVKSNFAYVTATKTGFLKG